MRSRSLMAHALTLSTLAVVGVGAGCGKSKSSAQNEAAANRPVAVSVAPAVRKDVPVYLDGLGSVAAWKTVTVRAQVDGRIDKVLFKEGQVVKKGEVLAQIDPRPFLAQLHQAEGALARDNAALKNNRRNLERYISLRKQDLIAQQQSDDQQALVDQALGAVGVDQAQVETARLQLSYAQITSPIDGVTGIRLIDEGNLVHASDAGGVVVMTQLDPIAVIFMLPEDDLPRLLPRQLKGPISVDAFSREGDEPLGTGELVVIDNQINQATATVRIKAEFRNPTHKLWPNQFIKARLLLDTRKGAIVVPAVAVQRGPKGTYVYTVGEDQTANPQQVEVAAITGAEAVITGGLSEGMSVVIEGQNQLRAGIKVTIARKGDGKGGGKGQQKAQGEGRPMSISEPFIRRPVATTLLMVGLMLTGLVGYRALPVSALPQVDYPTIVVATTLPGASAETMASAVTTPLERQLGQMPSVTQMTSVSSFATSQITIQFNLDRDIDAAEQDVQAAINAASNLLPRTLPAPPTYSKSNPADTPVLTLAVSGENVPLRQVNDFADSVLAQKIAQIAGVGLVTLNGGQKPAVRVQVDPSALSGAGLSLEDVRQVLVLANVNQPKGSIDGARQNYALETDDQLTKASSYRPMILAYRNGAAIRLNEVATIIDGVENTQLAGWAADKRAVILNVQRQPGANVIQVAERVKELLPQLRASLPQGVTVSIVSDRTETVRASVEDVEFTLLLTIGLVVAVIYVFLRSLRATLIPGVVVPLSIIGTFGVMYLLKYSLNNLSLMALTISTGFVVDDAIVMIENIARYIEEGEAPLAAALKGARQIGFTIVSLTVSLIAVLIPLLLMGGVIGRLFREFAITLSIAIFVSAILSLTLTATMCAHLLKPHKETKQNALLRFFEAGFDALLRLYDRSLKVVLRHQLVTLLSLLATMVVTVLLAIVIPKGFFPLQDTGLLLGVSEVAPDASFDRLMEGQQALAEVILRDPDVATVASFIGADGTNLTPNSGRLSVILKPHGERHASASEIMTRLRPELNKVVGIDLYLQAVQDLQIDSRISRTQFQYTLEDADPAELRRVAPQVLERLRALPELRDVASDLQEGGLKLDLTVDRDTASRLGITMQAVDDTLYDAFGQRQISTIFTQQNQYRVILEVKPELQKDFTSLREIYVRAQNGTSVPLSTLVHPTQSNTALSVNHQGQFTAVTISFNAATGVSLGQAVDAINESERNLPPSIRAEFQGTAQAFAESLRSEPLLILAALLTVYIVLGVLYESYIHPITILSTLPSAGVGALVALLFCHAEFSVIALIGIILLIGIVKKNAIMMIDFALEEERGQGKPPEEAIYQACLMRFRPIIMTTMAALLGGLPLALGHGVGAELRRPLGISIVGGLILSQLLTLYTTPVVYLYMDRLGTRLGGKKRKHPPEETSADDESSDKKSAGKDLQNRLPADVTLAKEFLKEPTQKALPAHEELPALSAGAEVATPKLLPAKAKS